jgi:hypothetical protein
MMRIASLTYNEAKDCLGSGLRDEKQISTYILSFQIADQLLRKFEGSWNLTKNEIILDLHAGNPIMIDLVSGTITYGTVTTFFYNRYQAEKGVEGLVEALCAEMDIQADKSTEKVDYLFKLFVKLVEIFHARCDLRIIPGKITGEWEISLSEQGPVGWISEDYIAENRFGEKIDISQWENLRPEKAATYIFGFNRFCKNFQCPMK